MFLIILLVFTQLTASHEIIEVSPVQTVCLDCHSDKVVWKGPDARFKFPSNQVNGSWRFYGPPQLFETLIYYDWNVNQSSSLLKIVNFRGAFLGSWICYDGENNNTLRNVTLKSLVYVSHYYEYSLLVGLCGAGSMLMLGIVLGIVRSMYETKCCTVRARAHVNAWFGIIPVPFDEAKPTSNKNSSNSDMVDLDEKGTLLSTDSTSLSTSIALVFADEKVAEEYAEELDQLAHCVTHDPVSYTQRLTDFRQRLQYDLSHKVGVIRSNVQRGTDCMYKAVQSLSNQTQVAANKVRLGLNSSIVHVKDQMRVLSEFCGGKHVGSQTISIVNVVRATDGEEVERVLTQYTFE